MQPASGRRRSLTHGPTGQVDGVVRLEHSTLTTSRRQRHSQLKRLGVVLALAGTTLLILTGSNARLDAFGATDSAQKLLVVRVDTVETSENAESAPGTAAVADDQDDSQQQQSQDAHLLSQQSESSTQPPQEDEVPVVQQQEDEEKEERDDEPPNSEQQQEKSIPVEQIQRDPSPDEPQPVEEQSDAPQDDPEPSQPLADAESSSPLPDGTRGIILCLHNGIVALGKAPIRDLRCMGNRERIQVYHCLPGELSERSRSILMSGDDDVEIVDVCSTLVAEGKLSPKQAASFRSYWIKPLALLHTDLDEVIMLDADALPLQDPAVVRSLPGYVATGTTFFHDRVIGDRIFFNKILPGRGNKQVLQDWIETFDYAVFGLSGAQPSPELLASVAYARRTCHEQDSSMVLVDKRRAGKAFDALWFLVTEKRFKLDYSWGDKEAFWLAFEFAHVPYFFSPWSVSVVSSPPNKGMEDHPETLCGSIAHFLPVDGPGASELELLYVNGKALLQQNPLGNAYTRQRTPPQLQYNPHPTHVTPRHRRSALVNGTTPARNASTAGGDGRTSNLRGLPTKKFPNECLVGLGVTPLSDLFQQRLLHRREVLKAIEDCEQETISRCADV